MSAPEPAAGDNSGWPPRRVKVAVTALALTLGLAVAGIWLLGRDAGPQGSGASRGLVDAPPQAREGAPGFEAPVPANRETDPATALQAGTPVAVAPLETGAAAAGSGEREIHGVALRASDDSPVPSAMVIALRHDEATNGETELAHAATQANGAFTLLVSGAVDGFRVMTIPAPGHSGVETRPRTEVPVRFEWAGGDTAGTAVRLRLDTGWRLDVHVVDSTGKSRAGVVVNGGGHSATSDAKGLCTLLDLPAGDASVTLSQPRLPDAKSVTHIVPAPEAGRMRQDIKLTVP
jgi:hypothetical protein